MSKIGKWVWYRCRKIINYVLFSVLVIVIPHCSMALFHCSKVLLKCDRSP
ncbi:MAG: IlvGEDA operon leader peptide [Dolichospermum sp.]